MTVKKYKEYLSQNMKQKLFTSDADVQAYLKLEQEKIELQKQLKEICAKIQQTNIYHQDSTAYCQGLHYILEEADKQVDEHVAALKSKHNIQYL